MRRGIYYILFFLISASSAAAADIETRIRTAVRGFIQEQIEADSSIIALRFSPLPEDYGDATDCRIEYGKSARSLSGRVMIPVRLLAGGRPMDIVYVRADIRCFDHVAVAAQKLGRGRILRAGDLRTELREVTRLSGVTFSEPAGAVGMKLRRFVTAGKVLTRQMVTEPPLIESGDVVKVRFTSGNLSVITSGTAREDGTAGEMIRVRPASGGQELSALVTGAGIVDVKL